MARKSKRRFSSLPRFNPRPEREVITQHNPFANRLRLLPVVVPRPRVEILLSRIEDRRTFHPDRVRPARGLSRRAVRFMVSPPRASIRRATARGLHPSLLQSRALRSSALSIPSGVSFHAPKTVLVCVRRKTRREVLFATNSTGKGARARRRRQSEFSDIGC